MRERRSAEGKDRRGRTGGKGARVSAHGTRARFPSPGVRACKQNRVAVRQASVSPQGAVSVCTVTKVLVFSTSA